MKFWLIFFILIGFLASGASKIESTSTKIESAPTKIEDSKTTRTTSSKTKNNSTKIKSTSVKVGAPTKSASVSTASEQKREYFKSWKKFFDVLSNQSPKSEGYRKAVQFFEGKYYNHATFKSLSILANLYATKGDWLNELQVRRIILSEYSNKPESHYGMGLIYKKIYLKKKKSKYKDKAMKHLTTAILKNSKYEEAYQQLIELLKEKGHTTDSLNLTIEMTRNLDKPENYRELCEAYYEVNYFKQSFRSCKDAKKYFPKDAKVQLLYALSLYALSKHQSKNNKEEVLSKGGKYYENKKEEILSLGEKHTDSLYVQKKLAEFVKKENPTLAITHLMRALKVAKTTKELLEIRKDLARWLYKEKRIKDSLDHFSKACLLSHGAFINEFQKARNQLLEKSQKSKFTNAIDNCFESTKPKNQVFS